MLSEQATAAWEAYLRVHFALTRALNLQMLAAHGMSLNDYEVLLRLWRAPDRRMRRVDLAGSVFLTASGITRLLDRLEAEGLVCKAECSSDARVTYAVLTDAGCEKLVAARETHLSGVRELFADPLGDEDAAVLATLLGRIDLSREPA
jgi:DNA-binding MarR family transcriptional regulator